MKIRDTWSKMWTVLSYKKNSRISMRETSYVMNGKSGDAETKAYAIFIALRVPLALKLGNILI